jgi:carboxyl-terminal processing protease
MTQGTIITPRTIIIPRQRLVRFDEVFGIRQLRPQVTVGDLYQGVIQLTQAMAYDDIGDFVGTYLDKYAGQIQTMDDLERFANEALASLDDPYTRFLGPKQTEAQSDERQGTITGIGVIFKENADSDGYLVVDRLIEEGPAYKAGMRPMDVLVKVGDFDIANKDRREIVDLITGEAGTVVKITVKRGGETMVFDITRGIIDIPAVRVERVGKDGKIAFLKFSTFMQDDAADEMEDALTANADADGYIVGLRFNPGGQVGNCLKIASMFIKEGVIVKIRQRIPNAGYQTTVYRLTADKLVQEITNEDSGQTFLRESPRAPYLVGGKKVVVLIDKWSASASEMFAGAVKDNGAGTIVGMTSYGKGIGQTPQPLVLNTMLVVTTLRYFSPNGDWFGDAHKDKRGVKPHFEVSNPEGTMPGSPEDKQLAKAIELIESGTPAASA